LKKAVKRVVKNKEVQGLAVYLIIATFGFLTNVGSRIFYSEVGGIRFGFSVILAYLTGMVVGFTLTKLFAFGARNSGNMIREMVKFSMVSAIALLVTWAFSIAFLKVFNAYFQHDQDFHNKIATLIIETFNIPAINRELASHLGGTGFGFFANFFGHKFFTFRTTGYYDKVSASQVRIRKRFVKPS